jgi:hypothetical protein
MKHIRIQQDNYNELFYEENNVIEVARLLKYITWLVDLPNDRNKCMWWL